MRTAFPMLLLAIACSALDARADAPLQCRLRVVSPIDGATNVAPDATISYDNLCTGFAPTLVGPDGQIVFTDANRDPEQLWILLARPRQALTPGVWEVHLGTATRTPSPCSPATEVMSRFEVGGAPRFLSLTFYVGGETGRLESLDALEIAFSEPFAESPIAYLETNLPIGEVYPESGSSQCSWGYKGWAPADRPKASEPVRFKVRKDLPFVSGGQLSEDVEFTVTPSEWTKTMHSTPWHPGDVPCPAPGSCSTVAGSGLPGLFGLLGFLRVRRRTARPEA